MTEYPVAVRDVNNEVNFDFGVIIFYKKEKVE